MASSSLDVSATSVSVLIVGGGPVGLCFALFLARQGISPVLVERHASVSLHPRARALTVRTMELFRELGLEERVREAGAALAKSQYMLVVDTLAGKEHERSIPPRFVLPSSLSPTTLGVCAQDQLEPLLRDALLKQGMDVRFSTELVSFEQTPSGIRATLLERTSGTRQMICADYLVAADGAHSSIRQALAIATQGREEPIGHYLSAYFRADLSHLVQGREFLLCFVRHQQAPGMLVAVNNRDYWIFQFSYHPERGEAPEQYTNERIRTLVRQAVGLPYLEVETLSTLAWEATSFVAEQFQTGRVFLIGDAAHVIPPAGGYGMNIGIEDAHNLAWKLALVLKGVADASLLTSYQAERHPHAHGVAQQAELRMVELIKQGEYYQDEQANPLWVEDILLMLGYAYSSEALVLDGYIPDAPEESLDPVRKESDADQTVASPFLESLDQLGRPGTRSPHVWLLWQGKRISLLDLLGRHFVLLCGEDGQEWYEAAQAAAARWRIPLLSYRVGRRGDLFDLEERWNAVYGVATQGAALIRPDGCIAWRSPSMVQSPAEALEKVLAHLLGKAISP